jgi:hypothetical protein
MDVVIDIGLGLGLLPQQIDEMTPDEVFKIQDSKEQEFKHQRYLVSYGAWLGEALHRTKKLPSLSEVLDEGKNKRKQNKPKVSSLAELKRRMEQAVKNQGE